MEKKRTSSFYTKMSHLFNLPHPAYKLDVVLQSHGITNATFFVTTNTKKAALTMPTVLQDPGDKLSPDDFSSHFVTLKVKKFPHFTVKLREFFNPTGPKYSKIVVWRQFHCRQTVILKIPTRHFASHFWVKNDPPKWPQNEVI